MTNLTATALLGFSTLSAVLVYAASSDQGFWASQRAPDFKSIEDVSERKSTFFGFIRQRHSSVNEEVARERETVLGLQSRVREGEELTYRQGRYLERLSEAYEVSDFDPKRAPDWERLLARVDIVPESLALAQAANESAWGTSRFAREGKNYFGHWCYRPGCGMVPAKRSKGQAHEVRSFDSARDSVAAYVRNLNTQGAFREFRATRAAMRARGEALTGMALAGGLRKYSSRGQAYVKELRRMIRVNQLEPQVASGPPADR